MTTLPRKCGKSWNMKFSNVIEHPLSGIPYTLWGPFSGRGESEVLTMHCYSVFYEIPKSDPWLSDSKTDRYICNGMYMETRKGSPPPAKGLTPERLRKLPETDVVQPEGSLMQFLRRLIR